MFSKFIHLHVHSEYSLDTGFFNITDYIRFCYKNNIGTAVITEKFNLFSGIKFYNECLKFSIKPIIGCEIFVEYEDTYSKIIILAKNFEGYSDLITLLSQASLNKIDDMPVIKKNWIPFLSNNIIIIGVSFESDVGKYLIDGNYKEANNALYFWNNVFKDNYYLGVTKFNLPIEKLYIEKLHYFTQINKVNLVAINEVCFLKTDDFFAYKTKISNLDINKKIISEKYDEYIKNKYFKLPNEMFILFNKKKELLYNSFEIAKKCNIVLNFKKDFSPKYLNATDKLTAKHLTKISVERLFEKLAETRQAYWGIYIRRLKKELNTINSIGFADYFLITHDYTVRAKKNNIFVGPGRGSGSGSLVAHLLEITIIDPIKYNLLFERFLNTYRISKPDFDIDFCIEGRDIIIDYIFDRYNTKNVAQIITFGLMAIKAAIRDIGRILGYPYFFVDKIIKLISNNLGITIKSELIENKIIKIEYDNNSDVQIIINLALKLEGMIKNIGKHAGGLVISDTTFTKVLPIFMDEEESKFITHFEKNDSEKIGFSKFDFLGLKTLSILSSTVEIIMAYKNIFQSSEFNIEKEVNFLDKKTLILLQRSDTLGIFQLDSIGLKSVMQKMKPGSFLDIVALIALYRPGPLQSGMLKSFINRKLGIEKINYAHENLKKILSETYGMLVYQEQVMLIAQIIAKYDIGFADFLRIAMSKKKKTDILSHLENFKIGASLNNITPDIATEIFELIEKFAGYGFNKAHSVGYGILTYQSAWLKAHYNIFFIVTLLSSDIENYDITDSFMDDAEYFHIKIIQLDINRSFYPFTIINQNKIRYGFGVIKGLGKSIISEIIHNRSILGPFNSFFEFLYRMNTEILSKRVLESLIYSGSFKKINSLKFKLVLISAKVFDIYFKIKKIIISENFFLDSYFNYYLKDFNYILNYKQTEIKETQKLLNKSQLKNILKFYIYENNLIEKLSFKSSEYINKIYVGIIKNIHIKNFKVHITITGIIENNIVIFSYTRYKFFEKILKKYNLVAICCYERNNLHYELFVENFYLFRYKFLKQIEIILHDNTISEKFLKYLFKIMHGLIKGCTKIIFKFSFKGKYKILNSNINFFLHDNNINDFLKFKEIKGIKFIYKL